MLNIVEVLFLNSLILFEINKIKKEFTVEGFICYMLRVGIALSVLFNVILGGYSNQSFSARNYEWKRQGKPNMVWLIDKFFWCDANHCLHSWSYWIVRKDL